MVGDCADQFITALYNTCKRCERLHHWRYSGEISYLKVCFVLQYNNCHHLLIVPTSPVPMTPPTTTTPPTSTLGGPIMGDSYCSLMSPCKNGGRCRNVNGGSSYECFCPSNFVGRNCDVRGKTTYYWVKFKMCIQELFCVNVFVAGNNVMSQFRDKYEGLAETYFNI